MQRSRSVVVVLIFAACAAAGFYMLHGSGEAVSGKDASSPRSARLDATSAKNAAASDEARPTRVPSSDPAPANPLEDTPRAAAGSETIDAQSETVDRDLDRIAESFLSETPDCQGLARFWDRMSKGSAVVPGSVKQEGLVTTGEISLPGTQAHARFQVSEGQYRVTLDTSSASLSDKQFAMRSVVLTFRDENGVAARGAASVQHHPDTGRSAAEVLGGAEKILGWSVTERNGRLNAVPITARLGKDGQSWEIGRSLTMQPIPADFGPNGQAEQALLDVIKSAK